MLTRTHTRAVAARGRQWAPVALVALAALVLAASAHARVLTAVTIDGPSSAILGLGGVAMAPDGTGGLVYLKLDQGEPHVFVSQFLHGRWMTPERVDTSLVYDSNWPAIGAGNGGRLVVIWAQSYAQDVNGNHFRAMYSAVRKPGSGGFSAPIVFDQSLRSSTATGDEASSELYPSIAMNAAGRAFLVYHVVTDPCTPSCRSGQLGTIYRPGDLFASDRVARFNGETWSVLGDVNRNPAFSTRPGTAVNSPQVVIDAKGNGVMAFQEPDNSGFDRIWARRLFGGGIGRILPVSAQALLSAPVNGDADGFSLAGGTAGAASVAYRQNPAPGSVFSTPRILINSIATPSSLLADPSQFDGAQVIDNGLGALGTPAVGVAEPSSFSVAFAGAGRLQSELGDTTDQSAPAVPVPGALGPTNAATSPGVALGADGSVVTAFASTDAIGRPLVAVDEKVAQNVNGAQVYDDARGAIAASAGGPISSLTESGDGFGDALVAFQQGVAASAQIAGAVVQGPPPAFNIYTPPLWVRRTAATLSWDPALDGLSNVRYTVTLDGAIAAAGLSGLSYRVDPRGLADGSYAVVVIATDAYGQQRLSAPSLLQIDDRPPRVSSIRIHHRTVTVSISDGPLGQVSGVDPVRTWVSFGDRSPRAGVQTVLLPAPSTVAEHRYRARGMYTITVHVADAARNARTIRYRVRVR